MTSPLVEQLPDPCLLNVMQCLAPEDLRSLFSAARAHSRLHQAAVLALKSISAVNSNQQRVNKVLQYLDRHGQHVDRIKIKGKVGAPPAFGPGMPTIKIWQLPTSLRLGSLQLESLHLQLLPGGGFRGVLGAAAPAAGAAAAPSTGADVPAALTQLCLKDCALIDGDKLTVALQQLRAGLEHLSLVGTVGCLGCSVPLPTAVLQQLQQLTYLELASVVLQGSGVTRAALMPLQALTRLADLRLDGYCCLGSREEEDEFTITASMLFGTHGLTRLALWCCDFEPGALAGKTQLQHLSLRQCGIIDATSTAHVEAQLLLSHLHLLQQLTHLCLEGSLETGGDAAAYAALTASSKLQHLDISSCWLPAGVWQHLFPAGKQLPNLQALIIKMSWDSEDAEGSDATAPEGSRLVSCCPGLLRLDIQCLQHSAGLLPSLQGLSGLHTLLLHPGYGSVGSLHEVCQLTGLKKLRLVVPDVTQGEGLLRQLTQLQGLTHLDYYGPHDTFAGTDVKLVTQGPGDEPVWRQLAARVALWHDDWLDSFARAIVRRVNAKLLAQRSAAALAD